MERLVLALPIQEDFFRRLVQPRKTWEFWASDSSSSLTYDISSWMNRSLLFNKTLDSHSSITRLPASRMEGSGPEEEEKEFTSNQGNARSIHLSCLIEKVFRFQSSDL
nr:hypothetical protein MFQ53_mgp60 [Bidens parviflora]YP_010352592.1 hypothetical protein MFQ53_mgp33 [Bidens parviflora]YP_010352597.1 hypothetical protein MFQ53_mgp28 [Bidens parviflora]UIR99383.1 hypothetical protein [Bidens alba var. radiata]UIR98921.1 hypothetical protein [Bidens parviflora]UIR98945.1 hypothetical protein [Bidens parviflora]UIR98950.1 hypothetical protein [Bidens parviflora]